MSTTAFTILFEMFYDSRLAFSRIMEKSRVWLPLIAVTLGTALMYYWYYQAVDFDWLVNHTLAASPDLSAEQRESARAMMTYSMMMWSTIGGTLVLTPLLFLLFAVYYLIAGKFLGSEIPFGKWFAFCVWTAVPRLLVFPLMALQIMNSKGQVALEDLSMVSLNSLLLHLPNDNPWAGFASAIDLTIAWSCVLAVVGLRVWTGRRIGTCIVITFLPLAVIYSLWAAKIVAFS